jgi:hypothetical protein
MKPKPLLFFGCVITLVLVLLFFYLQKQSVNSPKPITQITRATTTSSNIPVRSQKTNYLYHTNGPSLANRLTAVNDREKTNEIRQYIESQNRPMAFYGQVVDQDGNALAGVSVKGEILHVKVVVPTAWGDEDEIIPISKETDLSGRFEIQGIYGRAIELESIQKTGYDPEPMKRAWGTSEGSFENPVIFKMWSTNIHEPLVSGEKKFHIVPDGRIYTVDLSGGTIAQTGNGDLKIWVKRPDPVIWGQRYDWSCEMDTINGGLLQETNFSSPMFFAPADGYEPTFLYEKKIGSGWGDSTGPKRFYLLLKNGQKYGRITIEFYAYYNDHISGLIDIKYAVNPTGSRILR